MSPKGRHAKSKARISAYEALLGQEAEKRAKELEIYIPPGPRLGDVVIEAKQVGKGYGDLLLNRMTCRLRFRREGLWGSSGPTGQGRPRFSG